MRWLFITALFVATGVQAKSPLEFSLHKLESGKPGPTVLVVGGIQGDEPGGFHAASLLVTDYRVSSGNLWVVPNLNFESIIRRSRGVNGDMNRKFAALGEDDPDYAAVERIKTLIRSPDIDFILNLHDGSGFYREKYIDKMRNPNRWGQSVIIDQEELGSSPFSKVGVYARAVAEKVNARLLHQEHRYHVRNTRTAEGDEEMEKTLTYFAIRNGKPAIGLEASKSLPTRERVYYHLHLMESFLAEIGVRLERDFKLEPLAIKEQIDSDLRLSLFEERIHFDVASARHTINYFPLQREDNIRYLSSNPLLALVPNGDRVRVSYGNRRMTLLKPQFMEYDDSLTRVEMEIDGERREVPFGTIATVGEAFSVHPPEGYRVNVIGWTRTGLSNEAAQSIRRGEIRKRFSIDRNGTLYRVEVYRDDKFSGMVLVRFGEEVMNNISSRAAQKRQNDG
ncbi:MAG: hypothetical protein OEZ16_08200 [Chromatiales bacterium]|nr:hypothetical protein [Chromatiales bacterium]